MKPLYDKTTRIDNLINTKYNLVIIWEHEFDKNKDMSKIHFNSDDLVEPLKIRDCFYGGRTEPTKLIHNYQKGRYIDVCSLYPTVMYHDKFPIGHPKKIFRPESYDSQWFGFIHCRILSPQNLYHPVLPYKQNTKSDHKLLFGLCRSCMNRIDMRCRNKTKKCKECFEIRNLQCDHIKSQREITRFWTSA